MSIQTENRLIMMVSQAPFEIGDSNQLNQFCKLIPMAYEDGSRPDPKDFPNDGEVWWMLTAITSRFAVPGQLVSGFIERAFKFNADDPQACRYQAVRDSIQELNASDGFEVVDLPGDKIEKIQDVVARGFRLESETPLSNTVMLHWRSNYYGPFTATRVALAPGRTSSAYSFFPAHQDGFTIYQVDQSTFDKATKGYHISIRDKVSRTDSHRDRTHDVMDVRHDFVRAAGYEQILAANPQRLALEPIDHKLVRFAKDCLTRAKRQQFKQLLEELEITGRESEEAQELVAAVEGAKGVIEKQEAALSTVTEALLKAGLLGEDRIKKAEEAFGKKYVEEKTAELQAKVEETLTKKRGDLRSLDEELKHARANVQKEKERLRTQLAQEIAAEREFADQQMAEQREALETEIQEIQKQKTELQRQEGLLQKNLEKVTAELRQEGDNVVNRFLTIAPLLGALGPATRQPVEDQRAPVSAAAAPASVAPTFQIPAFVSRQATSDGELKEDEFFDRFRDVVESSGFTFRLIDLQRFHLSVKCGELTVLGGPSGTGKSSLPALYAQALLGEEAAQGRPGCLMVNINPSWMDTRDLLGHMNTLEGRFYPAESGLFQQLIFAQKEHEARGPASGLYLTCLDEMNLSQVEHYFSDFMMVLERSGPSRKIQVFSPETAGASCSFRPYGTVTLSPALRFIGTVNFDETTRLLSDRFLDRVNLIRLTSAGLPSVSAVGGPLATATGRMVTLADMEGWRTESALPTELGLLLDQMRPLLAQMGCPISPRAYRAICRFVGSAMPIMSQETAFELQVAQRVIPRIRSLVSKRQLDALDALMQLLKQSTVCAFEETIPLLEEVSEGAGKRAWDLDE